jgi:DNA-binding HxlR family transcriptional regulator
MSEPKEGHLAETCRCPVIHGGSRQEFEAALRAGRSFGRSVTTFLAGRSAPEQAKWLRVTSEAGRPLFQPWCLEIVFATSLVGRMRFGDYGELLGVSPKTLSQKLQVLREAELIERTVQDTQPVLIEYSLTPRGEAAAALAAPLLAHLNLRGLGREKEAGVRPAAARA